MQHSYFSKISFKSYLPRHSNPNLPQPDTAFNQSSYQFHHQVPQNLETQVSSLLITRPTTKLHYQICLHKSEWIFSKIKPKPLKPSLTSPRQVPYPTGNQTSIQDTHRTTTQPKPLISLPQKMCVYQLDSTYVTTKP